VAALCSKLYDIKEKDVKEKIKLNPLFNGETRNKIKV
jgi:hypothetical protein